MKKGLLLLGLTAASVSLLAGCGKKDNKIGLTFEKLSNALKNKNYTLKTYQDEFFSSIESYDKANNAICIENHFVHGIDKDYTFVDDGKVVSVIYTNYTVVDDTNVPNENGEFKYFQTTVYPNVLIDNFFDSIYSVDKLFMEADDKIVSAGIVDSPKTGYDRRTCEASNVVVENDKVKFDLNVVEIQDESDHTYDREVKYESELYNLESTKVEITQQMREDAKKHS